jgi:hypothetical protein
MNYYYNMGRIKERLEMILTYSRNPMNAKICNFAASGMASQASGAELTLGNGVPSNIIGQGQVIPLACTIYPTKANIAMRPCLTSDSLKNPMVSSWVVPQKLEVERPRGSKRGTTGFSFFAKEERSSRVSILREEEETTPEFKAAPLKEEEVKAAAVDARIEVIASFIMVDK